MAQIIILIVCLITSERIVMNLALKYRPTNFGSVVGQSVVVRILQSLGTERRDLRVVLLGGQYGVGKTTLARLYAKILNCENVVAGDVCGKCDSCVAMSNLRHPDYSERDMGSAGLVADVRRLRDEMITKSMWKCRVFVLDEIHGASREAFNALLKVLEEPPEHAHFVMCTTALNQVPYVIASRSLTLKLFPLSELEMSTRLLAVASAEDVHLDPKAAQYVARNSGGSMRDCYMMFERLLVLGRGKVDLDTLRDEPWFVEELATKEFIIGLVKADKARYYRATEDVISYLAYETLLRETLRRLSSLYLKSNRRPDKTMDSVWDAYVRMINGADPSLVIDRLWMDVYAK